MRIWICLAALTGRTGARITRICDFGRKNSPESTDFREKIKGGEKMWTKMDKNKI